MKCHLPHTKQKHQGIPALSNAKQTQVRLI